MMGNFAGIDTATAAEVDEKVAAVERRIADRIDMLPRPLTFWRTVGAVVVALILTGLLAGLLTFVGLAVLANHLDDASDGPSIESVTTPDSDTDPSLAEDLGDDGIVTEDEVQDTPYTSLPAQSTDLCAEADQGRYPAGSTEAERFAIDDKCYAGD